METVIPVPEVATIHTNTRNGSRNVALLGRTARSDVLPARKFEGRPPISLLPSTRRSAVARLQTGHHRALRSMLLPLMPCVVVHAWNTPLQMSASTAVAARARA